MSAAKKPKTSVAWPTIDGVPTMDGVEKPLVQTLATVCSKLYDEVLHAAWKPKDVNKWAQPYELSKEVGIFNKDTTQVIKGLGPVIEGLGPGYGTPYGTASLAQYGTVIDGITDFHGENQAAFPPFAALIVQPNDREEAPILILAWRGSITLLDWISSIALSPILSSRWSGETKDIHAHGAILSLVENTFSLHEREIVDLVLKPRKDAAGKEYKPVERAFITGHSIGGGLANVAHLVVRAQLKKTGSPWHELAGKVTSWRACTFAALQTIVRKYDGEDKKPPLMAELDDSSYNVVYGCDAVSRVPGMLKYFGALVEHVAPKILEENLKQGVEGVIEGPIEKTLGYKITGRISLKTLIEVGQFVAPKLLPQAAVGDLDKIGHAINGTIDGATDALVEWFKDKVLAEVIGLFSNVGTVLYLHAEGMQPPKHPVEYVHLKGEAAILEKLDVEGDDFLKLWGDPTKYMESEGYAHNEAYHRLVFGATSD